MRRLLFVLLALLLVAPVATAATYAGRSVAGTGIGTYFDCFLACRTLALAGYDTLSEQFFDIGPVGGHAYRVKATSLGSQPAERHTVALAELCFYSFGGQQLDCSPFGVSQSLPGGVVGPEGWNHGVVPPGAYRAMVGSCVGADIRYELVIV